MKYVAKIFFSPLSSSGSAEKLEAYLNKHDIEPEDIVNISMSEFRILLVYIKR